MAARTSKTTEPTPAPPAEPTPEPPLDLTYEQARDELIAVVARLESGGESLAESMALFKRGEALAALCERYLTEARATIEATREA